LSHNRKLTKSIMDHAEEMGLPLATPKDEAARGGSVMLQLPETADPAALVDGLRDADVHVDCRGRILRISPGAVTKGQHVDRLFRSLKPYV
jgi:kynureninase